jgi:hypothetical protein
MHRHKDAEQTAYYRQQASACATAASATAIAEVKQAYLDLEQGWLCLAPKVKESIDDPSDSESGRNTDAKAGRPSNENAVDGVTRQDDPQA